MKKAIIDCGGWKGDSIEFLRKQFGNYTVHTFECNPVFFSYYNNFENHILHKKAVWIFNGDVTFYLQDNPLWDGHSICKEKSNVKYPITVKCIDFSKWILDNFTKEDELFLKMNIEGAEYKVLDKMLKDNSIDYFNKQLIISFHQERYTDITSLENQNRIIIELKKRYFKIGL